MSNLVIAKSYNDSYGVSLSETVPNLEAKECEVMKVVPSKDRSKNNSVAWVKHPDHRKPIIVEPCLLPRTDAGDNWEYAPNAVMGVQNGTPFVL